MANENEGQALREYGSRKKRLKRRRRFIIGTLLLLFLVVGVIYFIRLYYKSYQSYGVLKTTDISGENAVGFLGYGSSVVKYSKDGAEAIDKDGNLLWNGSYELSDPIADTCGKYVVIAGKDTKEIHIYDRKGEVGCITTEHDILKVEIASQGVVAALMEDGNSNHIVLYDVDGTVLVDNKTTADKNGYPMDISLSDDGKKLVLSYLSYSGGKLADNVSFYNFGDVGQNYTDGAVGGFVFDEGIVVPRVAFINNDTVVAYKDDGFVVYDMKELPSDLFEQNFDSKIQSVLYNTKYVGVVLQTEGTSNKKVILYNMKGKKILEKNVDFDYEDIYLSEEEIVMYNNTSCFIMKSDGRVKFKYSFSNNIDAMYPVNNLDRYYLASGKELSEIQLKE
jgi:hypothetical protein